MRTRFRVLQAPRGGWGGTCTTTPVAGGERAGVGQGRYLQTLTAPTPSPASLLGKGKVSNNAQTSYDVNYWDHLDFRGLRWDPPSDWAHLTAGER